MLNALRIRTAVVGLCAVAATTAIVAQERGVHVRAIRVLATDPEALATFYTQAFGLAETRRPVESETFTEIIINSGSTPAEARGATTTPIVIATRAEGTPAGGMAALILNVPDLDAAIEAVKAGGGALLRPPSRFGDLGVAFVTDPDGNQIELIASAR